MAELGRNLPEEIGQRSEVSVDIAYRDCRHDTSAGA
jgi:hypothetical protein